MCIPRWGLVVSLVIAGICSADAQTCGLCISACSCFPVPYVLKSVHPCTLQAHCLILVPRFMPSAAPSYLSDVLAAQQKHETTHRGPSLKCSCQSKLRLQIVVFGTVGPAYGCRKYQSSIFDNCLLQVISRTVRCG